jgi:RimJ/RimL family protein N-acetyltransferase
VSTRAQSDAGSTARGTGPNVVARTAPPPRELRAGHVTLHAFDGDEGPMVHRAILENVEHLRPWMPWAQGDRTEETSVAFVRQSVEEWDRGVGFGYWMREEAGGALVGCAGLHSRIGPDGLEIGYWVSEGRTRRGYATESARALTTAAFGIPGVRRVEIHCDEANLPSAAVPRRLGFRLEKVEEVPAQAPAETGRHQVWVVDAAQWVTASS